MVPLAVSDRRFCVCYLLSTETNKNTACIQIDMKERSPFSLVKKNQADMSPYAPLFIFWNLFLECQAFIICFSCNSHLSWYMEKYRREFVSLIMRDILFSHIHIKGLLTFEGNWWLFLYSYRTIIFFSFMPLQTCISMTNAAKCVRFV